MDMSLLIMWILSPAIVLTICGLRIGPEELTEAYPERPSKEAGKEA
jgi:hypothetical protein